MLSAELIDDVASLQALETGWDELAVECETPHMAPRLALAWWRHLAPEGAQPRSVAVREGGRLVALAPFYVAPSTTGRVDYRLPGIELGAGLAPLARPGREWEAARPIAQALARALPRPDLVALEGHPLASPWPLALRSAWPGRMRAGLRQYVVHGAPTISLDHDSYDRWLASKSSNFRGQMRRIQRQFVAAGGHARLSSLETVRSDIDAFMALHAARWEARGSSGFVALGGRLSETLADVATAYLESGRFRLWMLEVDGAPISAQLFFAIGGRVSYINGGWDERFAHLKPAMLGILHALADAFGRGDRTMDLGAGEQRYKLRLADANDPVAWSVLIAPGVRR
ncbi:MAG: GNAT family N-acetyltransferase, partial [Solirubrobacteraceae bacterium]